MISGRHETKVWCRFYCKFLMFLGQRCADGNLNSCVKAVLVHMQIGNAVLRTAICTRCGRAFNSYALKVVCSGMPGRHSLLQEADFICSCFTATRITFLSESYKVNGTLQQCRVTRFDFFLSLTHCRPAMPFGNRKIYFRGSLQFIIVTIKKTSPIWKPEI